MTLRVPIGAVGCSVEPCLQRCYHSTTNALRNHLTDNEDAALDQWTAYRPCQVLEDPLSPEHLQDLHITLPTRDGSRRPFEEPVAAQPIPYGHHLAFFHPRKAQPDLREDGTEGDLSPPPPFTTRMWAGGSMKWREDIPMIAGVKTKAISSVERVERKGHEKGQPMLFVTQAIRYFQEGQNEPSVTEERTHVYLHSKLSSQNPKVLNRPVKDVPTDTDFAFEYIPTTVMLFRYSALMFNAHHIHLDKEYCLTAGYPERLVHGPLTAQMLLETVNFHLPGLRLASFEYRARNPLFVNQKLTVNGKWRDDRTAVQVWCHSEKGVIGMTGQVNVR